jgi:protein-S-isoprenylcysteine O-methyltransferase Ste14
VACLSLLLVFHEWRSTCCVVWDLQGGAGDSMRAAFLLAWGALFYSLWISGLGRQTGWTTWYAWFRRRSPPASQFQPRGWYRWFRHPIYFSFLGLIWLTPQMTLDRGVLAALWSAYIFIGSRLKDARLEHYIGAAYREYESRVPGFPFMFAGPLGRRRSQTTP